MNKTSYITDMKQDSPMDLATVGELWAFFYCI